MGRYAVANHAGGTADDALWVSCVRGGAQCVHPARRAEHSLTYLEVFPTGRHNRAAAEAVELCLDQLHDGSERRALKARLRALRDPYFPPIVRLPSVSGAPSLPPP